ncbi:spore coat protein [Paenibacillus alba]|uniref:spore coat protein n=1 Tax=Paenibacillus alba TaxID=1197127 RepID=UPI0015634A2B|nr:spore coat protein [Paenibacillus alba]NQX67715.1 spore coat protein [Paenibacillus alba]
MSLNYLGTLIGTEVKVNRGGPDSIVGRLVVVHHDYLVLQLKDGTIVYIQLQHIKSLSATNGNVSRSYRSTARVDQAHSFEGVLSQFKYTFVQINRGGPEKIEGVVVETWDNNLLLVVNNEIVRIPIFHIKSINAINKNNSSGGNKSNKSNKSHKSNKATAAQIVAIKLLLKKYRTR